MYNNDITIRKTSYTAPREIKASANFDYVNRGITLDGSKFATGELLLEGQCLMKDDVTGKYEKYADSAVQAAPAILLGANAITPVAVAGLNAGTRLTVKVNGNTFEMSNAGLKALPIAAAVAKPAEVAGGAAINNADASGANAATVIKITVNGKDYIVPNANLAALAADSTDAVILAALAAAAAADGASVQAVADLFLVGSVIHIATKDVGASQSVALAGTWGAAGDEVLFEGIFGISFPVETVVGAASAAEQMAAAIGALSIASGLKVTDLANVDVVGGKLRIVTKDSGAGTSVNISGTWGAAGDEATVEGILGVAIPAAVAGQTATYFPAGKSDPVILDESIKIPVDELGANVDVTAGQVLIRGSVLTGMLIGCTEAFKAKLAGAILFRS